jgi:chromosome segregation ATPase
MADYIEMGDYRVDRLSQLMLVAMEDGPKRATELQNQADIDNYGKLSHRMDKQLKPAGLVEEMNTVRRKFRLTDDGKTFVDEHTLEVRTLDDIREVAVEARQRTETLSGTVGSITSKLENLQEEDQDLEGLAQDVDELQHILILGADSPFSEKDEEVWLPERNLRKIKEKNKEIERLDSRINELEEKLQSDLNKSEELRKLFEEHRDSQEKREKEVDKKIVELAERIEELSDDLEELEEESVSDLEEEIEKMQESRLSSLLS